MQNDLFDVGADLSVPVGTTRGKGKSRLRIGDGHVAALEEACDRHSEALEPLTSFVLSGGTPAAAALHVARTTCRRAERCAVALAELDEVNPAALAYLNRLSDLLFILARVANDGGRGDVLWQPGASIAPGLGVVIASGIIPTAIVPAWPARTPSGTATSSPARSSPTGAPRSPPSAPTSRAARTWS